ncbi:MAG: MiaB/RimO family radical SAM methylthiotransferase [Candidatus Moraniibacteriota bacterium]
MSKKYFIKTFGCQQNVADSERIASFYESRGFVPAETQEEADTIVINTCVIRERASEKVYGLVKLLEPLREKKPDLSIVITGCLIGAASREPSGKMMKALRTRLLATTKPGEGGSHVQLLPLEEVGFEYAPKRSVAKLASIPISNGCNNYCTYCIVPFSRGKERSRPFEDIIAEAEEAVGNGAEEILLLGQNVNSYGADLLAGRLGEDDLYALPDGTKIKPVMVKHLNRHRIPTLFPHLLEQVAQLNGVKKLQFISSNPWDFSDELIDVIAQNENIDRVIHLPVQSGSDTVLKNMNRWYTREEYISLIDRIKSKVPGVRFTTDIIVGFPGETLEDFEQTLDLARRVKFEQVFSARYSPRPGTKGFLMPDEISFLEKKRRHRQLDDLVFRGIDGVK